jgi:hypothetical protein
MPSGVPGGYSFVRSLESSLDKAVYPKDTSQGAKLKSEHDIDLKNDRRMTEIAGGRERERPADAESVRAESRGTSQNQMKASNRLEAIGA